MIGTRTRLRGWRRVLGVVGYPGVLAAALVGAWLALSTGMTPGLVVGIAVVAGALVVAVLERIAPYTHAWKPKLRGLFVDLVHTGVSAAIVAPLVRASALALVTVAAIWLSGALGRGLWPTEWPLALQVALAVVIADLGAYGAHRFMHLTRVGWRIHVVHHTAERLHFLAAARAHPLNAMLTLTLENAPLILLGITPEALALAGVMKGVNGLLQHSNADLRPGILSHVLATCDVHRWHHSRDMEESNTNFGNVTTIWDRLFGTLYLPPRAPTTEVGIAGATIPERYLAHLAAPFVLGRWEEPEADG